MDLLKRQGYAKLKIDLVPMPRVAPNPSGKCEFLSSMVVDSNYVLLRSARAATNLSQAPQWVADLHLALLGVGLEQSNAGRALPLSLLSANHQFVNSCFGNLPAP